MTQTTQQQIAKDLEQVALRVGELNGDKRYYVWECGVNKSLFDQLSNMLEAAREDVRRKYRDEEAERKKTWMSSSHRHQITKVLSNNIGLTGITHREVNLIGEALECLSKNQ